MPNFDAVTEHAVSQSKVVESVGVRESVFIDPIPSATNLLAPVTEWTWRELRDYVVGEIEARFGPQPHPYPEREAAVFKSFMTRHPEWLAIANYAFNVCDGWWAGAPISVNRFAKASDAFFAAVIVTEKLS